MAKSSILGIRVTPETKGALEEIADREGRTISQICELLLLGGIEHYRHEGYKYLRDLILRSKGLPKPGKR